MYERRAPLRHAQVAVGVDGCVKQPTQAPATCNIRGQRWSPNSSAWLPRTKIIEEGCMPNQVALGVPRGRGAGARWGALCRPSKRSLDGFGPVSTLATVGPLSSRDTPDRHSIVFLWKEGYSTEWLSVTTTDYVLVHAVRVCNARCNRGPFLQCILCMRHL